MLRLSSISDLMAYRYFLAVNNPAVQELELCEFSDYYQGIIELYPVWIKRLEKEKKRYSDKKNRSRERDLIIPLSASRLDAALKKYEEDKKGAKNERTT